MIPDFLLSTPHGALGTIRDLQTLMRKWALSTPHGALGTSITNKNIESIIRLSTPHGALGTFFDLSAKLSTEKAGLSTPHGALGTREGSQEVDISFPFQLHTVH